MALYASIQRTAGGVSGTVISGTMSVLIYDAATGSPANGNNCVVSYTQNINGFITQDSVIVPGTSYPIYSGMLSNSATGYFTDWSNITLTPATTPPPPIADDLTIGPILTTAVSAVGATDGIVKIIASSSFGPIQYSLDNSTWQTSNVFTNQPGGAGTAYAKDANGGLISLPYTVDFLGRTLVSDPSIDLGNGNVSYWNAAFNPIWFKFQRHDFEVTSVVRGDDGNIVITVNADMSGVIARVTETDNNPLFANPIITIKSYGDLVYLDTALYQGSFEVLEQTSNALTLDCAYNGDDTIGFVNIDRLKANYVILMKVIYVSVITGKSVTTQLQFIPGPDGSLLADLSNLTGKILQAKDNSDYSAINYRDSNLSGSFTVQYAESWTGASVVWITLSRPYYVVFTAKQLGDYGGGNLVQYVPFQNGFQPAKWLTDFASPTYSPGFPFDLPFIFSEYMVGLAPFYNVTMLDINQNVIATVSPIINGFLLNEDGSLQLNQDASKFIIAEQASTNTPIIEQLGLNRLLINFALPSTCYFLKVQLQYTSGGTTYNLLQPLIVKVFQDTPDNPVYLRWIGLNGSWNYYRFVYNQQVSLTTSDTVSIKRFIVDWQKEDTINDIISRNGGKKMQVFGENVHVDDIDGLESLFTSPKVQLCTQSTPPKWLTVVVDEGSYVLKETYIDQYSFSMSFALPQKNLQVQ